MRNDLANTSETSSGYGLSQQQEV